MTLRRRNFLGLFGAAIAAPMIPVAAPAAGFSRTTYELAIAHAQKYPQVSVRGLVARLGMSNTQANAVITQMSSDGVLGVLNPTRPGTVHAASKVYTNPVWSRASAKLADPKVRANPKPDYTSQSAQAKTRYADVDLSDMLAHLRGLCVSKGMTLSPLCAQGMA
ncbi:MAG: hypothetical protein KC448_09840 [Yoonia sp.]|nr:hypothetical protein [Yoonia sp.]